VTRSDGALVEASRRGDREAFRELVERHFRRVLAVASGMLRSPEDAKDVAQETFIKAYRSLASFKGDSTFYTWLYRITVNLCIDQQRRQGRVAAAIEPAATGGEDAAGEWQGGNPGPDPFERVRQRELGAHMRAALDELTPEHRAVILLREIEGLSYEEISHVMQCAKGTVMSRLHYARKRLQDKLRGHL
jgi:RNA polymerase sigma-70 factor (ECF subfamily)